MQYLISGLIRLRGRAMVNVMEGKPELDEISGLCVAPATLKAPDQRESCMPKQPVRPLLQIRYCEHCEKCMRST